MAKGGTVRGLTEGELISLDELVCQKVGEKINVLLPDSETPYHKLVKWIKSIERKTPVEIFTTNYDLLMEQSLDSLEVPYFDGFVGSRRPFFDLKAIEDNLIPPHWSRLWKVHGSINWYSEKNKSRIKVYRSSEIKEEVSKLIYPSHLKYDESRKMPYIALIDQLNRFIREKSSFLILSGYSFNDEHLNGAILNSLKSNPTAMVLALMYGEYEEDGKPRYPKAYELAENHHNLNIWTFDKAIIGTNVGKWVMPDNVEPIEPDIDAFIERVHMPGSGYDSQERAVKLGDFSKFAEFLKRTIGSHEEIRNE